MLKNGYPNHVVDSATTQKLQNFERPVKLGPNKCSTYLHLPWLGTVLMRFEKQIMTSVGPCYFSVEPRGVFATIQL